MDYRQGGLSNKPQKQQSGASGRQQKIHHTAEGGYNLADISLLRVFGTFQSQVVHCYGIQKSQKLSNKPQRRPRVVKNSTFGGGQTEPQSTYFRDWRFQVKSKALKQAPTPTNRGGPYGWVNCQASVLSLTYLF